jgi:hypothetical protein
MGGALWQLAVCKVRNHYVFFMSSYALLMLLQQVLLLISRVQPRTKAPTVSDKPFSQFVAMPLRGEVHSIVISSVTVLSTLNPSTVPH